MEVWRFPRQIYPARLVNFDDSFGPSISENRLTENRFLDPFRTGFVTKEEFFSIIKDIEERLTDTDLAEIAVAFGTDSFKASSYSKPKSWRRELYLSPQKDTNHDDRVNYVEFLRPFASRRSKNRQAIEETTLVVQVSVVFRWKYRMFLAPPYGKKNKRPVNTSFL